MSIKILGWKTPCEVLYNKVPAYDDLKVVGFLCFAPVLDGSNDKMDPKGHKYVFLWYPSHKKKVINFIIYIIIRLLLVEMLSSLAYFSF